MSNTWNIQATLDYLEVVNSANPVGGLFTQPLLCWSLAGGRTVTEVS